MLAAQSCLEVCLGDMYTLVKLLGTRMKSNCDLRNYGIGLINVISVVGCFRGCHALTIPL